MLRALLIGVGARGRMWAQLLSDEPHVDVVAYVDPSPDGLDWARTTFGQASAQYFTDLDACLAAVDADFAVLVTPPYGRLDQANKLFAKGLHVLAEKPLSIDFAEAAAIVRAAEQAGCMLSVGLNFRYLPVSQEIRAVTLDGKYGAVGSSLLHYARNRDGMRPELNKYPLTMDQPMLLEQSIHHFDLIRFCYAQEVHSVIADTFNTPWSMYRGDALVTAVFQLAGGARVTYLGTWVGGWNVDQFQWRTDYERGVLVQQRTHDTLAVASVDDDALQPVPLPELEPFTEDTRLLLQDYVAAVRDKSPPPCSGKDHLRTLAMAAACAESAASRSEITMADYYRRNGIHPAWIMDTG